MTIYTNSESLRIQFEKLKRSREFPGSFERVVASGDIEAEAETDDYMGVGKTGLPKAFKLFGLAANCRYLDLASDALVELWSLDRGIVENFIEGRRHYSDPDYVEPEFPASEYPPENPPFPRLCSQMILDEEVRRPQTPEEIKEFRERCRDYWEFFEKTVKREIKYRQDQYRREEPRFWEKLQAKVAARIPPDEKRLVD